MIIILKRILKKLCVCVCVCVCVCGLYNLAQITTSALMATWRTRVAPNACRWTNTYKMSHGKHYKHWLMLSLIDPYLCTILWLIERILITAPARFGVRWHYLQGAHRSTATSLKHIRWSQGLPVTHCKIARFHTTYTTFKYHINLSTDVYVY